MKAQGQSKFLEQGPTEIDLDISDFRHFIAVDSTTARSDMWSYGNPLEGGPIGGRESLRGQDMHEAGSIDARHRDNAALEELSCAFAQLFERFVQRSAFGYRLKNLASKLQHLPILTSACHHAHMVGTGGPILQVKTLAKKAFPSVGGKGHRSPIYIAAFDGRGAGIEQITWTVAPTDDDPTRSRSAK